MPDLQTLVVEVKGQVL